MGVDKNEEVVLVWWGHLPGNNYMESRYHVFGIICSSLPRV